MPRKGYARFKQAERDLVTARHALKAKDYYAAAFWSQQAVEKGLKGIYLRTHDKIWKIHDLVALARKAEAPQKIIEKCAVITPVYTEIRYP